MVTSKLVEGGVEFELTRGDCQRLERLVELWLRYGRVMNLTAAKSLEELVPHVLEAILAVSLARELGIASGARWLDVGSGAGFPGLVIAALTDVELTLVEPRERRASFLEVALAQLQRPARVLRGHVDAGAWSPLDRADENELRPGEFDAVSARAVYAPERWLEIGSTWANADGWIFAHLTRENVGNFRSNPLKSICFDQWSVSVFANCNLGNK
jgi:16S rRNA (guanine527-N7)-methyltransferase